MLIVLKLSATNMKIQNKDNSDELSDEIWAWFDDSDNESLQTLNKMKLFGYEIEEIEIF